MTYDEQIEWHRHFIIFPTIVQTKQEFYACRSGTRLVGLRWVWRQNIASGPDCTPLWRYVLTDEKPY